MEGQAFWVLKPKPGCQINAHIKSVNRLEEVLDCGTFADDLFVLLTGSVNCEIILYTLLETYFPNSKTLYLQAKQDGRGYYHGLEGYVLNEPQVKVKRIKIETEEDVFVRGELFKR